VFRDPRGKIVQFNPKSSCYYDPALSSTYKYVANQPVITSCFVNAFWFGYDERCSFTWRTATARC
jgi:hypothetical protein